MSVAKPIRPALMQRCWGLWAVTGAALALRLRGFEATAGAFLGPGTSSDESSPEGGTSAALEASLDRHYRALSGTGRLPWSTCLTRSLALCRSVRDRSPRLHLGTRREGEAIAAHAWVALGSRSWGREGYEAMTVKSPPGTRSGTTPDP